MCRQCRGILVAKTRTDSFDSLTPFASSGPIIGLRPTHCLGLAGGIRTDPPRRGSADPLPILSGKAGRLTKAIHGCKLLYCRGLWRLPAGMFGRLLDPTYPAAPDDTTPPCGDVPLP